MTRPQNRSKPKTPALQRSDDAALPDAALEQVSGGTEATSTTTSNVLKTKHDTVKNSISNIH